MLSTEAVAEGAKCEQLENVVIDDDKEKFFQLGVQLPPQKRQELIDFLRKKILMYSRGAPTMPLGWIQISFAIV